MCVCVCVCVCVFGCDIGEHVHATDVTMLFVSTRLRNGKYRKMSTHIT